MSLSFHGIMFFADACAVTAWSNWSDCSVTCDWGLHQRERTFIDSFVDRRKCARVSLIEVEKCQGQSRFYFAVVSIFLLAGAVFE